jgi:hypothetical protein
MKSIEPEDFYRDPKTLRDEARDRIFPPGHEHEFLEAHERARVR